MRAALLLLLSLAPGLAAAQGRPAPAPAVAATSVLEFGAKPDGRVQAQASLALTGGTVLTLAGAPFACPAEVGKIIAINETAGATTARWAGRITGCLGPSQVQVDRVLPNATLANATIAWGSDNSAAIAAAAASCRSIDFGGAERIFFVTTLPTLACSGVAYLGQGATIARVMQGTWGEGEPDSSRGTAWTVCAGCDDVRFSGLTWVNTWVVAASQDGRSPARFEFSGNHVLRSRFGVRILGRAEGAPGATPRFGAPAGPRIQDNHFEDVRYGVLVTAADNAQVTGNRCTDSGYSPRLDQAASGANLGTAIRVQHCIQLNCGTGNTIRGNRSTGGQVGIILLSRSRECGGIIARNSIIGNEVAGFREEGISLDASPNPGAGGGTIGGLLVTDRVTAVTATSISIATEVGSPTQGSGYYATFPSHPRLKGRFFQVTGRSGGTYTVAGLPPDIAAQVTPGSDLVQLLVAANENLIAENLVRREAGDANSYPARGIVVWLAGSHNVIRGNRLSRADIVLENGNYLNHAYETGAIRPAQVHFNTVERNTLQPGNIVLGCYVWGRACTTGDYLARGNRILDNQVEGTITAAFQEALTVQGNRATSITISNLSGPSVVQGQ